MKSRRIKWQKKQRKGQLNSLKVLYKSVDAKSTKKRVNHWKNTKVTQRLFWKVADFWRNLCELK